MVSTRHTSQINLAARGSGAQRDRYTKNDSKQKAGSSSESEITDEIKYLQIEKQILENKLQYELIESQLEQSEEKLAEMDEMLQYSRQNYQQSVIEVQNCRNETRDVKMELNDLKNFSRTAIKDLSDKLDALIKSTETLDYTNIGNNVQLVLDQYMNTKFGNEDVNSDGEEEYGEDFDGEEDGEGRGDEYEAKNYPAWNDAEETTTLSAHPGDAQNLLVRKYINHPQVEKGPDGAIKYSLAKDVQTVERIWAEYYHGIQGGPSIKELEATFATKWRHRNENSTFLRRKKIYKALEYAVDHLDYTEEEAIKEMEDYRTDKVDGRKKPMYWLYDNIPAKFKPNL